MTRCGLFRCDLRAGLRRLLRAVRSHGGEIAYYACIALALTALAFGAERFRRERAAAPEPAALPAVDFAGNAAEDAVEEDAAPALPEGAEVLRAYSDAPAWSGALGLWESHPAIDCRLPGGEVCCLLPGTVRAVERGSCVEVDCGDVTLRYASILPRADLAAGDALEAGELIGSASDAMPGEAALGAHLHLELIRGGEPLDFLQWAARAGSDAGD